MDLGHPGCYGLPVAVSATSPSCSVCPSRGGCVFAAQQFLETLPDTPAVRAERQVLALTRQALASVPDGQGRAVGQRTVVASSRGVRRITLTAQQLEHIATLPARVASQVKTLMERGWFEFARSELQQGRNPADKGWKKTLCQALLDGRNTRAQLEMAFVQELNLSVPSAKVQLSVGLSVMAAGRLAAERLGQVSLLPN